MTSIVYNGPHLDLHYIEQFSKGEERGVRIRDGHLNVWVFDDGIVHLDPIQNRIGEAGEFVCDTVKLNIEQAQQLAYDLLKGVDAYFDEFGGEDYEEYEEARSGGTLTATNGWDPEYPETSLVYDADGKCLGRLMSVDPEAIAANPSIQPWSKPTR